MKDPNTTAIETSEHLGLGRKSTALRGSTGLEKPTKGKWKTEVKDKKKKKKRILICLLAIFTSAGRIF